MSNGQALRRQRSSLSSLQRNRAGLGGGGSSGNSNGALRTSGRQTKIASQGFYFGDAAPRGDLDAEKAEKELVRARKRREQRLEELERGSAPSSWNDSSSFNVPAASTSAAAIAGLLAGRQAEQEESLEDSQVASRDTQPSSTNVKKRQTTDLRRLLTQRRSLKVLLEDAAASPIFRDAPNNFLRSLEVDNPDPIHRGTGALCSICGYWGDIRCRRCNERVCGLKCRATHDETRCERPL